MEISKILTSDILDIIFEGKNKDYGAYSLRKTYWRRLTLSISVMSLVVLLLIAGFVFGKNKANGLADAIDVIADPILTKVELIEEKAEIPHVKPPEPIKAATIDYSVLRIVPEEQVKPKDQLPDQNDLNNARIDDITRPGDNDGDIVAPPANGNDGTVVAPIKVEDDYEKTFTKVELESSYPGGLTAWRRYLIKTLKYPQQAIDNEIQGVVEVQFMVDKEGNVSEVQAISGPNELREEAVRVIKKSGKWTPAIQNGREVKSYKKQPIHFQLQTSE